MTRREYERCAKQYSHFASAYGRRDGYSGERKKAEASGKNGEESGDGYFAFFKLRCLICFVLFLALVAVDKRIDVGDRPSVKQAVDYLNQESIPASLLNQTIEEQ